MSWTEFTIIYLACGAPFGVYQITREPRPLSASNLPAVLAAFFAWPVVAVRFLWRRIFPGDDERERALNIRIERARAEIESIASPAGSAGALFEFRDVYYRYTALAVAVMTKAAAPRELFEVSGHSDSSVAAKCLARRNREKLAFHHVQARNEFVDVIAGLMIECESDELIRLTADLANDLGDVDAAADLNALISPAMPQKERTSRSARTASVR
jgi:hypothetical protein